MPSSPKRSTPPASPRHRRRLGVTLGVVALPLVLAACSSGSGGSAASGAATTTGPTDTSSASSTASPTASPTPSDTAPSDTSSATGSPTPSGSPSPSGTPSTVSPSPTAGILGITVVYSPVTASAGQQVSIVATTSRSLAGRTAYIVKTNDGAARVLGTGTVISASGVARTYVQLLRTGVLEVVVPRSPLVAGPFDPATSLLARSAPFTVTIR